MEIVTIFMAWPYANGPLHLGHIAGNCLPADIQYKFERSKGNKVLMCSGSDEHGTPITVSAEEEGVSPQEIVDRYHDINLKALIDMGCSWGENIDPRGIEYGGTLYNRTTDYRHKELVQEIFTLLLQSGFLEEKTMKQYCSILEDGTLKFLPDRYVEGECPSCGSNEARGDQCDSCGITYESNELINPRSKMNPDAKIEIKDTDHLFFKLQLLQKSLENYALERNRVWKPNVRSMTKNWLNMGLRSRAVTRDISWGIELPLDGDKWNQKRVYVWFEAVQGYYTCARIWAEKYAKQFNHPKGNDAWEDWLIFDSNKKQKHIYFMGKDNIPFHTIIWPALIMAINSSKSKEKISHIQTNGNILLANNVASNEYLMLQGGQFSKSRKHAVWLPNFLEKYDPDALRYYLSINMPENHDTDFRWEEFVDKVNNELIGNYGNFVNRVLTLTHRVNTESVENPLSLYDKITTENQKILIDEIIILQNKATESLERQRFKEALRHIMTISQKGNILLQNSAPWKHLNSEESLEKHNSLAGLNLAWRLMRGLAILTRPFMPFQSNRLWEMIGETVPIEDILWNNAFSFNTELTWNSSPPTPLFKKLDLEEILISEGLIATEYNNKEGSQSDNQESVNIQFEDFIKIEMKTGKIISVEEHPNADKLWVIKLEDTPNTTRTICAGLKGIYGKDKLKGMNVVYVANLEPRKLRGILSEGMLLAADDGNGNVKLLTPEGDISTGSLVR
ncbi:MAG: methionine--tRNA ligase [Marine Group II euryarchaeote MED-G38]|nr:MAG: methionine--tRNA ligase [Marine Group II euryarchaeote MED-G38]|tara:strand:- start:59253 stop:61457 length:2205 start_codon:yes stop_codon:yes gene_type:complete